MKKRSKIFLTFLQLCLAAGLFVFLIMKIDLASALDSLRKTHLGWLALAFAWQISLYLFRACFLYWLAREDSSLTPLRIFRYNLVGTYFSNFFPSQVGGDLVRSAYFWPYFRSGSKALAIIIFQRLLGFCTMLLLGLGAALIVLPPSTAFIIGLWALVFGGVLLSLFLYFRKKGKITEERANRHRQPLRAFFKTLLALQSYHANRRKLLTAIFFALCISLWTLFLYWPITKAIDPGVPLSAILVASSAILISGFIPLTPGNIGISEGAFVGAAALVAIPAETSLAVALLSRAMLILVSLFGGILYFLSPIKVSKIHQNYFEPTGNPDKPGKEKSD